MLDTHLRKKNKELSYQIFERKRKKLKQNYKVYRHLFSLFGYGLKEKKYKKLNTRLFFLRTMNGRKVVKRK